MNFLRAGLKWLIIIVLVAGALLCLVLSGYEVPWTGFGEGVVSPTTVRPKKLLWDWLDLFIVPIALALLAWALDSSRKRSERRRQTEAERQQVLDRYFEFMSELLLGLNGAGGLNGVTREVLASVGRTRTLAALRALDGGRKAQLLQFLQEAGLAKRSDPIISLIGADLSGAQLKKAALIDINLRGSYLRDADFRDATLREADLRGCDLSDANMKGAALVEVDLHGANLMGASLNKVTQDRVVIDPETKGWLT